MQQKNFTTHPIFVDIAIPSSSGSFSRFAHLSLRFPHSPHISPILHDIRPSSVPQQWHLPIPMTRATRSTLGKTKPLTNSCAQTPCQQSSIVPSKIPVGDYPR